MPFNFDKSSFEAKLPAAGKQTAAITDVNVHEGDHASWLNVTFGLDSGHQLEHMVAIDADQSSSFLPRVSEGLAFMESMCKATRTDITTLRESEDIINAFVGVAVDVVVALRMKAGMKRPVVKTVLPHEATDAAA